MNRSVAVKRGGRYYKLVTSGLSNGGGCPYCDLSPASIVQNCGIKKMCSAMAEWTGDIASPFGWYWEEVKA